MREILEDPVRTGVCIVATPEEMPVNETIELAGRLRDETNVELAAIVVNRVLPELFGRGEEACFERLREPALMGAVAASVGASVDAVDRVMEAARLAVTLRRTRAGHLERLRDGIDASVPMLFVPELFARSHGLRATRQVAEALAEEME
jgi:anion-transporting  ArsA/GET3 family ATPase